MAPVERWNGQLYMNQALFADHYLRERMADHPEWGGDIRPLFDRFKKLYVERLPRLENANEAQTEDEFIKQALEFLGFEYIPQIKYKRLGQTNRPDYALFPDANTKDEAYPLQDDQAKFFSRTLAICEAKYWGRPLDGQTDEPGRDQFENAIPGFQIVNYLMGTEVDWGILTNGKLWRLYYQRARSRTTTYYEVDLEGILSRDDTEAFRYFYHFFNRRAFSEVDHTGKTLLERVYEGSITHAEKLGRDLKALVFEEIFIHLAEGFMEYRRERLGIAKETEEGLREIFSATLRLLYRLLFILYAEARDLLPVSERLGYYKYSLTKLKQEIAQDIMRGERLSRVSDNYWNDLAGLFRIIDRGDPSINVPTYNGSLFRQDHPKNAFLNQHRISDFYSAKALDLLTREQAVDSLEPRFIDYRDLGVRELGSIYEGLLEFYLRIAQEDLAVVKAKGREVYVPLKEAKRRGNGRVIREGELYLENDRHERKATGTYYTPDYIVKYIVKNTVRPVLEERTKAFEHWMEEAAEARKGLRRLRSPASIRTAREELDRLEMLSVNALLDVKILDPAMGSGHFLVEAVDQLTDGIVNVLASYPDNPVLRQIERIRRDIRDNLEKQGIKVNEERLSDEKILKRMVMKRCVYGVDLNEMAVELAKLSLWLNSFTVGAPLSFLDHHLKTGNSLIGARVGEVREAVEGKAVGTGTKDDKEKVQSFLLGSRFAGLLNATQLMLEVGGLTDATFAEVERSASLYEDADKALRPYKRLLDLWTSEYFGNKEAQNYLRLYGDVDVFMKGDLGGIPKAYRKVVRRGGEIAEEKHFFHWELEFPEVFYESSGTREHAGFDAVVGNPPYVPFYSRESMKPSAREEKYLATTYSREVGGRVNTFLLFLAQSVRLSRQGGSTALIVPDTIIYNESYEHTRRHFLKTCHVRLIYKLAFPVFQDPTVRSAIPVIVKNSPGEVRLLLSTTPENFKGNTPDVALMLPTEQIMALPVARFPFMAPQLFQVNQTVLLQSIGLSELAEVRDGINPGPRAFRERVVNPKGARKEAWGRLIEGEDINRYQVIWSGKVIDYDPSLVTADLKRQGVSFREPWIFSSSKLVSRQTSDRLIFAYDDTGLYALNSVHHTVPRAGIDYSLYYLLSLLNSRLINRYYRSESQETRDVFPQVHISALKRLPIRRIWFTTPRNERTGLVMQGKGLIESRLARLGADGGRETYTAFLESELGGWASARLQAEPEQSDVIHDLLASLAQRVTSMNNEKQAEAEGFLRWLAGYTGLSIEDWRLKTYVKAYWEHPRDELQRALCQNRKAIEQASGRKVERREAFEAIQSEFDQSVARLKPLLQRIASTDRLIDLIVYRLYGLTEEEVAMVEEMVAR